MRTSLLVLLLTACGVAQTPVVSPIVHTDLEGDSNNSWPWNDAFRYQQLHVDLKGRARLIRGVAWRRNQDGLGTPGAPRVLDMEILLSDTSASNWSTTFASNYVGSPVQVLKRKRINTADWRTVVAQRPAPFDFAISFDSPFLYKGNHELLYELVIYSTSSLPTDFYFADAVVHPWAVTSTWGSYTSVGSGCSTSQGTFLLRSQVEHVLAKSEISFAFDVLGGPPSSGGIVLLGVAPLNVPVPGLCANLYTDGSLVALPLVTSAKGQGATTAFALPFQASWLTAKLSAQAAAADTAQPGLPIAASQGVRWGIPPVLPKVTGAKMLAKGNPTATKGGNSTTAWLVTQFR